MLKGIHLTLMIGGVVAKPVPQSVIEALTTVQVTITAGQRNGFQLTFSLGKRSAINRQLLPSGYFNPPRRVIIVVTFQGKANVLMDGVITRQEISPSNEPGQSTLTITGEDLTRMMDLIDFSGFPFPAMPAVARVALIIGKYAMYKIVPQVVPSVLFEVPNPLERIPTQMGTDFQYITSLANQVGYVFYIDPGPKPGMNVAYWGPEIKTGRPQPALTVNTDGNTNVESLSFSFDGFAKTQFVVLIQEPTTKIPIPIPIPDNNPLSPKLGQDSPFPLQIKPLRGLAKYNPIQAAAIGLAQAALAADVISGSGSLDVLRYGRILKARQLVSVRGAGINYDGLYYVKSVTHNLKRGEYKQSFNLTRNAFFSSTKGVPT